MFGLGKLWGYIAAAGAFLVTILSALALAKREGRKQAEAARTEESFNQAKESHEIDKEVRRVAAAELAKRLREHQRD
jgi:hypothetical protein